MIANRKSRSTTSPKPLSASSHKRGAAKEDTALPAKRAARPRVAAAGSAAAASPATTKLACLVALLEASGGATLADLCAATGWQAHSVRGALAGTLKRKGFSIVSERIDGVRRYRIGAGA